MKKHKALKTTFLALGMALLLSACGQSGNVTAFSPIYIHADDSLTDGTARQILQHNELGKQLHIW